MIKPLPTIVKWHTVPYTSWLLAIAEMDNGKNMVSILFDEDPKRVGDRFEVFISSEIHLKCNNTYHPSLESAQIEVEREIAIRNRKYKIAQILKEI